MFYALNGRKNAHVNFSISLNSNVIEDSCQSGIAS